MKTLTPLVGLILIVSTFISCEKPKQSTPTNMPKLEICEFPTTNEQGRLTDTALPILSTPPCELCNRQPDTACMLVVFKSTQINSPYWNSGRPFTTYQVVFDTNQMKKMMYHTNNAYFRWRIKFTTDSTEFQNFVGYKEVVHVVSQNVRTDNQSSNNPLFNYPVGGVSYVGVLYDNEIHHSFVFADALYTTRNIIATIVHESGHSIGLSHQSLYSSTCSRINVYRPDCWMGNALSPYKGEWVTGPTQYGCDIIQNDTMILNSRLGKRYPNL